MERSFDVTVGGSPASEGSWGLIAKQNFLVLDGEVEKGMTVLYPCGIAGKITKLNKYSNGTFMEVGPMSCNYLPEVEFGSALKIVPPLLAQDMELKKAIDEHDAWIRYSMARHTKTMARERKILWAIGISMFAIPAISLIVCKIWLNHIF